MRGFKLYKLLGNLTIKENQTFLVMIEDKDGNLIEADAKVYKNERMIKIIPKQ